MRDRELHVEIHNQLSRLPVPHEEPFQITLTVAGLSDDGDYRLIVNESQIYDATAAELQSFVIQIDG